MVRLLLFLAAMAALAQAPNTWTNEELLAPATLASRLKDGDKPLMLYVGPAHLYRIKHIPGTINVGPTSKPEGLQELLAQVKGKSATAEVIVYCGCCPVKVCPNVRPAIKALKDAGFKNVRLLDLPTRFSDDWTDKGYPATSD